MEEQTQNSLFHIISFSMFSDVKGPVPIYCYPESVEMNIQVEIAMKSVSLLMGEAVYQAGLSDNLKYFGILPFPDLNYTGFTYFFLIPDEQARGKSKAATVTLVVKESDNKFIYDNIHTLRLLLDKVRVNLRKQHDPNDIKKTLDTLRKNIADIHDFSHPISTQSRLKLVFTGLDNSGKTSFLKTVKEEYSELMTIRPTKGIQRTEREILLGVNALEWDFGGQRNYREGYFENAALYLNDVDLLFYFIDIQDLDRLEESLRYLSQILHTLANLKNFPVVQIAFTKYDPDLEKSATLHHNLKKIKNTLRAIHTTWDLKFFTTSIFDQSSINSCFSHGISRLSPNKTLFSSSIKKILRKLKGHAAILLTQNGLELGKYSKDEKWLKIIEDVKNDMYYMFQNSEEPESPPTYYHKLQIDGISLIFYHFIIDFHHFYLLFDSQLDMKNIERALNQFKKKISIPLHSYLH